MTLCFICHQTWGTQKPLLWNLFQSESQNLLQLEQNTTCVLPKQMAGYDSCQHLNIRNMRTKCLENKWLKSVNILHKNVFLNKNLMNCMSFALRLYPLLLYFIAFGFYYSKYIFLSNFFFEDEISRESLLLVYECYYQDL